MLAAIHPELVHVDRGEPGYTGDLKVALDAIFGSGVRAIAENGVIRDPTHASAEPGARYWNEVLAIALAAVASA